MEIRDSTDGMPSPFPFWVGVIAFADDDSAQLISIPWLLSYMNSVQNQVFPKALTLESMSSSVTASGIN